MSTVMTVKDAKAEALEMLDQTWDAETIAAVYCVLTGRAIEDWVFNEQDEDTLLFHD